VNTKTIARNTAWYGLENVIGFLASLLALLWAAAAGIVMFVRPAAAPSVPGHSAQAKAQAGLAPTA